VSVDLLFERQSGGSDLLFGWEGAPSTADAIIDATLPGLVFLARAIPDAKAVVSATLSALSLTATGHYQSSTARPTVGQQSALWQVSHVSGCHQAIRHQAASPTKPPWKSLWSPATATRTHISQLWQITIPIGPISRALAHQSAWRMQSGKISSTYSDATRTRRSTAAAHQTRSMPAGHVLQHAIRMA